MSVFDFIDYRQFLRAYLDKQPKRGHGVLSQWAQTLGVSTTLISQILSGKKSINLELAMGLATLLELSQLEIDHLFLLVELDRAGTVPLRHHFKKKIEESQKASRMLKNRIEDTEDLPEEVKARYYASWIYSAIRNLVAVDHDLTVDDLAKKLKIARQGALEACQFLEKYNLIVPTKKGWDIGTRSIYLSSDSPLVNKHHQNWRLKSLQRMDDKHEEDLFFTSPMSLSKDMALELRKHLVDFIQELRKKAGPTESQTVRCLNIDWFEY